MTFSTEEILVNDINLVFFIAPQKMAVVLAIIERRKYNELYYMGLYFQQRIFKMRKSNSLLLSVVLHTCSTVRINKSFEPFQLQSFFFIIITKSAFCNNNKKSDE